eukprot:PITA_17913
MERFQKKLKMLKAETKRWNKTTFGNILKEKEQLIQEIKNTQQQIILEGRLEELTQREQEMESKLLEQDRQEEVLWRQKSRIQWLQEGEKNTKFFHKTTMQRRMRNQISQVNNAQGVKVETQEGIEQEFVHYFKEMSKEPNINRAEAIDSITRKIPRLITEEQNTLLLKPISLQEVENAVNSVKASKAPGPDSFTSNFIQHFWELIKWEVWQVVEESHNMRWMYLGLNATFISLIPKSEESNTLDKYRPIALCNIIYKIISEVVALRLKPVLPFIISPEQSGYVEGCQIRDGIILTHEISHSLKHSKKLVSSLPHSFQFSLTGFLPLPFAHLERAIARILGFSIATLPSKYLGAPLFASAQKHSLWTSLLEKLEAKLFLWTHRSLNMASRLVLIKAVLQSMPLYLFSILAAPKCVLKAIKKLQRNFLWGSTGPNRKRALVKWEKACLPKSGGGIGLREPEHNNLIMGAKIWWKWLSYPSTQWAKIWTAKYANNLPLEERIRMSEISKGSTIWNSTILNRDLIQKHSFWEVKDGCTSRFWTDSWQQFPSITNIIQGIPLQDINQQEKINQFWEENNESDHHDWKEANTILPHSLEAIKQALAEDLTKRKILKETGHDKLGWGYEEKGTFTTKEAYQIILKGKFTKDKLWERIWSTPIWLKISTFL